VAAPLPVLATAFQDPAAERPDRQTVAFVVQQVARRGYGWFAADGGQFNWRSEHDPNPGTIAADLNGLPASDAVLGLPAALTRYRAEWAALIPTTGITPAMMVAAARIAAAQVLASNSNAPLTGLLYADGLATDQNQSVPDSFVPSAVAGLTAGIGSLANRAYVYREWVTIDGVGLKPSNPYIGWPLGQKTVGTVQVNLTAHVVQANAPPGQPAVAGLYTMPITEYVDIVRQGARWYAFPDLIGTGAWSGPQPVYLSAKETK